MHLHVFALFLGLAFGATLELFTPTYTQTGDGTYYGGTDFGHCSISPIPTWARTLTPVAMNAIDYRGDGASLGYNYTLSSLTNSRCGMCVEIKGSGEGLGSDPIIGPYTAYVTDEVFLVLSLFSHLLRSVS